MYEIRFHGRGGQGAVTAANLLSIAAFKEGYDVQSFPFFGVERRGAPVEAYTRIDKKRIRLKMNVYNPDAVMVLDSSLLGSIDPFNGIKENGVAIINIKSFDKTAIKEVKGLKIAIVDAVGIAIKHGLGSSAAPIVNTTMLGAYAKIIPNVKLESIKEAIKENVGLKTEDNLKACEEAYDKVQVI
jgi:2-oxoacid:acceptor oxidoreductase gamma subunit (pyruvate/2-ketoisovalerate family)